MVTMHWPVSGISVHVPCSIQGQLYSVNCFAAHFMLHVTVGGHGVPMDPCELKVACNLVIWVPVLLRLL